MESEKVTPATSADFMPCALCNVHRVIFYSSVHIKYAEKTDDLSLGFGV